MINDGQCANTYQMLAPVELDVSSLRTETFSVLQYLAYERILKNLLLINFNRELFSQF